MAKGKKIATKNKVQTKDEVVDPFIGGEIDDLSDMQYIQDETTHTRVETHPPETKEEAEALKEAPKDDDAVEAADEVDATEEETSDDKPEVVDEEKTAKKEETEEEAESAVLEDDIKVPKNRFDEVNERMKKAEEENARLKSQLETVVEKKKEPEPEPYDYDAREKEAMDALLEGDSAKYAQIRNEIRAAEKAETLREAKKIASQGDQQMQETLTFAEAGAKIEQEYPQFLQDGDKFNSAAYEDLMDLYVGYVNSGQYNRVAALQKAAERSAKMHSLEKVSAPKVPDNVVNLKKPIDVKAKAAAAKNQPPTMESSESERIEPKVDVNSMSDEEYQALPESTKRRLRGDVM